MVVNLKDRIEFIPCLFSFLWRTVFKTKKGRQSIIEMELKPVAGEEEITRQLDTSNEFKL